MTRREKLLRRIRYRDGNGVWRRNWQMGIFYGFRLCFFALDGDGYGRYGWRSPFFFFFLFSFLVLIGHDWDRAKRFRLHLDGDSFNGIMGIFAGSWMNGCTMTQSGLLFGRYGIEWRRLRTGWYPGLDSLWRVGLWVWGFLLRVIPMVALLIVY